MLPELGPHPALGFLRNSEQAGSGLCLGAQRNLPKVSFHPCLSGWGRGDFTGPGTHGFLVQIFHLHRMMMILLMLD